MGKQRVGQSATDLVPEKLRFMKRLGEVFCLPARKQIHTAGWLRAGACWGENGNSQDTLTEESLASTALQPLVKTTTTPVA